MWSSHTDCGYSESSECQPERKQASEMLLGAGFEERFDVATHDSNVLRF